MTEKEFNANCIKSMETESNVRFGGILCLMHYPVPEWAEEGTTDVDKSLYEHFKNHEYIVVFVYRYTRGKHKGEVNWRRESPRFEFSDRNKAEAFFEKTANEIPCTVEGRREE